MEENDYFGNVNERKLPASHFRRNGKRTFSLDNFEIYGGDFGGAVANVLFYHYKIITVYLWIVLNKQQSAYLQQV